MGRIGFSFLPLLLLCWGHVLAAGFPFVPFYHSGLTSSSRKNLEPTSEPQLEIALKFVEFRDQRLRNQSGLLNEPGVVKLIQKVNEIFSRCHIRFKLENYVLALPEKYGLGESPQSLEEMGVFRKPFDERRRLVIVKTQPWNHDRVGKPNAWTAMPGDSPSGVVIEAPVASFAEIVAHELGHYLNLYHVKNEKNLMNSMIYKYSTGLSPRQCTGMRTSAQVYWAMALRPAEFAENKLN